ncbi:MAG: YneF family protein [Mollicutes bacterium]|nr:YneF family protein [Mollicutes bacterium]MDD7263862.1 YneF family protein [bacterium]MDY4979743.1 YneF family protein [Candidatus Onthovivens sp.]
MIEWWQTLLWCLFTLIVGGIVGFFVARYVFKKQIEKNPPVNEKMLRAMFMQMGRKPSEAQIKAVMNSMKNSK